MIVFVHGVPETAAYWDLLRAEITEPSVALALPGFGTDRPSGFGATKDDYADWLAAELEAIDEPVDLVGHDWGAGFTYPVATVFRRWVSDGNGLFAFVELLIFIVILAVGLAYVWAKGDLEWVRRSKDDFRPMVTKMPVAPADDERKVA